MILRGASGWLLNECRDEEVLLCGPAGTSKTVAACAWLINACIRWPGSRHLLCRAERSAMTNTTLVTLESVIGVNHPEVLRVAREQRHSYRIFGSEIVCGGLDETTKLFGSAFARIVVEEAIEIGLETWELFGRAARDPRYQAAGSTAKSAPHQRLAVTNPGNPDHWLNRRATREPPFLQCATYAQWLALYEYSTGPQDGKMRRLLSVHQDNPTFFDTETWSWTPAGERYLNSLRAMSGYRKARMLEGRWVTGVGDPVFDPEAMERMRIAAEAIEAKRPTVIRTGTIRIVTA